MHKGKARRQRGEISMPTQEERLTTLEKTVALLQKSSSTDTQELSRNVTILLGILSSQQLDIKEIKISQITAEEHLNTLSERVDGFEQRFVSLESKFEQRFASLEQRFVSLEGKFEQRFISLEGKLEQVLQILTTPPKTDK
jgi:DNA repair exonuclease SbcCD ATPase subunit